MITLKRGMVIDIDLNPTKGSETGKVRPCIVITNDVYNERVPVIQVVPITNWSDKKSKIKTNVELTPTKTNGLKKKSIADCLQTRPVDYIHRLKKIRGEISKSKMLEIDKAIKLVFDLT